MMGIFNLLVIPLVTVLVIIAVRMIIQVEVVRQLEERDELDRRRTDAVQDIKAELDRSSRRLLVAALNPETARYDVVDAQDLRHLRSDS